MLISIAMMFLVGMSMGWICKKIHLFILLSFLDLFLTDHMIRCHRNPADQKIRIHNFIIQFYNRLCHQPR